MLGLKRHVSSYGFSFLVVGLLIGALDHQCFAQAPKVYEAGAKPNDVRYQSLKNLNGYFPFTPKSANEWKVRSSFARRQMLVAAGLWPMPEKTKLHAVVHGKIEMQGYSIEKVYFQSYPGHYVTGNLYRPTGDSLKHGARDGKRPVILSPHGHWSNGRFYDAGLAGVKALIKAGAELFEDGGRSPLQSRCVQLARMGCVVFHYDMEGYADSVQFAHRPGVRKHMFRKASKKGAEKGAGGDTSAAKDTWGLFSPQADLRLQSMFGLQTWNSVRALDFVMTLPEADADRVGVTGASGGGTQTMVLAAIDDRVDVSVPAVMVSTAMQGGCTCENSNYLRLNSGNIEVAALFAPKPQFLIAADDWTKELMSKGMPELERQYKTLGAADHIAAAAHVQFKHNYNAVNRQHMYHWFNKHFKLGHREPIKDLPYKRLTKTELTVWNDDHKPPKAGDSYERTLVQHMTKDADLASSILIPSNKKTLEKYRDVMGGALEVLVGRSFDQIGEVKWKLTSKQDRGEYFTFAGKLTSVSFNEELPAAFFMAKNWNKQVVVWVDSKGKSAAFTDDGSPAPAISELIDAGYAVAAPDLYLQGEFLEAGQTLEKARIQHYGNGKSPWNHYTGYTFGYNHTLFAQRVHDIMTTVNFVWQYQGRPPKQVHLVGVNGAGKWVAAASALLGKKVNRVAIDFAGFTFESIDRFDHPDFVPGIVKYGDVAGLAALVAPHPLLVSGLTGEGAAALIKKAYSACGASKQLEVLTGRSSAMPGKATPWLMK
jgi:dienelactone hydrolase